MTDTARTALDTVEANKTDIFTASQWQLMWWKFKKHKLAIAAALILLFFYFIAIFCEFLAPYSPIEFHKEYTYVPPHRIHFVHPENGFSLRPFVYEYTSELNLEIMLREYTPDRSKPHYLRLFVRGDEYKMWGLFRANIHLFGTEDGRVFLMGTDKFGRDVFSKLLYATRISMTIGLVGIAVSFTLGLFFGGISGYFGGVADGIIQRIIEIFRSFPTLPLWIALSAALPTNWSPVKVYFGITVILSFLGWTGLARVVRGKFLALREEGYVLSAQYAGASEARVIGRHMVPSFTSHIIASLTLSIPRMIIGETSLSFLGIGLRPPTISWGVMLQEAQNIQALALYPWLFLPGFAVIITVLAFNFLGDGLRDAADPYSR